MVGAAHVHFVAVGIVDFNVDIRPEQIRYDA